MGRAKKIALVVAAVLLLGIAAPALGLYFWGRKVIAETEDLSLGLPILWPGGTPAKGVAAGAAAGATIGTALGTIVPGLGNVVGGAVGTLTGSLYGVVAGGVSGFRNRLAWASDGVVTADEIEPGIVGIVQTILVGAGDLYTRAKTAIGVGESS